MLRDNENVTLDIHPLLRVIESVVAKAAPSPRWPEGDAVSIGIASATGPQWLTATHTAGAITIGYGIDTPESARAMLVMKASAADKLLGGSSAIEDEHVYIHPTKREESRVLGDVEFFKAAIVSAFAADSAVGVRVREVSNVS